MFALRATLVVLACIPVFAQSTETSADTPKLRIRAVKELSKQGSESIPRLQPYLKDQDAVVRIEAVKAIVEIGTERSLDPLIDATRDNNAQVQMPAVDGLVNFYLPGYVKTGKTASLKKVGTAVKSKFTDTNDQIIEPYIQVRPEVVAAIGKLVRGGSTIESRANAARAAGILRGRGALPDLEESLKSKETPLIYESLVAIQKINDPASAPRIAFLLRDLNDRVQIAAIETTGVLKNTSASADLRDVIEHARSAKIRRAALEALAMLPDPDNRAVYEKYFSDKDDALRAASAEGFARLKNPSDLKRMEDAFNAETKMNPRLSLAFATVADGRNDLAEFSPLQYLVNALNSKAYRGVAQPFLIELTRDPGVRRTICATLKTATRDEKMGLGDVLAASGDKDTVPVLETLAADSDADVAEQGLRALKTLKAKL